MQERTVIQAGETIRPYLDLDLTKSIVCRSYGLTVSDGKELNSYDDRNYHVTVKEECTNIFIDSLCNHGYVLKVLNTLDSKDEDHVDAQIEMILHLIKNGFPTPKPVKNLDGKFHVMDTFSIGEPSQEDKKGNCIIRLLEYLPGRRLTGLPHTKSLVYQIGAMTAKMDQILSTFRHKSHDIHRKIWNLTEVPKILEFSGCIVDFNRQILMNDVISGFQDRVVSKYPLLRKGTIHGDVNDTNILVRKTSDNTYKVCSIIDFGDSVNSYYIFEISILMCYMMIGSDVMDPIMTAGHALAGYLSEMSLGKEDLAILKECVCSRFIQSLVMGAYSASVDTENSDYLLTTSKRGWSLLHSIWNTPKNQLYNSWNKCLEEYNILVHLDVTLPD